MPPKRKVQSKEISTITPTKKTKTTYESIVALAEEQPKLSPDDRARKIRKVDRSIRQLIGGGPSNGAAESETNSDSSLTDISSDGSDEISPPGQTPQKKLNIKTEQNESSDEDDEEEEEEEEEEEWENVLNESVNSVQETPGPSSVLKSKGQDLVLTLDKDNAQYVPLSGEKKKGASTRERNERLWTHAAHVSFLTYHGFCRNRWLNDKKLQEILLESLNNTLTKQIMEFLHPVTDSPKLKKSKKSDRHKGKVKLKSSEELKALQDAQLRLYLRDLLNFWKSKFRINAPGLRKRGYREIGPKTFITNDENQGEIIKDLDTFREMARNCSGSRDVGAQFYTSLLRALGFKTRLVFSLCPLGYGFSKAEVAEEPSPGSTMDDNKKAKAIKTDTGADLSSEEEDSMSDSPRKKSKKVKNEKKKASRSIVYDQDLKAPTFWTEVYSAGAETWYPVDPIVLKMNAFDVGTFCQFEPRGKAAIDSKQQISYVVAYNADGTARDVTTRYLTKKVYPGKTKGFRLPVFEDDVYDNDGNVLFVDKYDLFKDGIMKCYAPKFHKKTEEDRKEDEELTPVILEKPSKVHKKGMPDSVAAFKNHPEYVLERFLKREEAIIPGEKHVQTFLTGKGEKAKDEKVYRRQSLVVCKAVENWHKEGRVIKKGVQPLKLVPSRAVTVGRRQAIEAAKREGDENAGLQGLYSLAQTETWIPPPVIDGKIPKNSFGNADCFVPSMIPHGAVHVPLKGAARICRKLGIDHAEAVTGFEFKKKRAIPFIEGVLVTPDNEDLLREAWRVDAEEKKRREDTKREQLCLSLWKKFLMGLRIIERVNDDYAGDDENGGIVVGENPFVRSTAEHGEAHTKTENEMDHDHDPGEGGFIRNEEQGEGGFLRDDINGEDSKDTKSTIKDDPIQYDHHVDDEGGGFLIEGDEDQHKQPLSTLNPLLGLSSKLSHLQPSSLLSSAASSNGSSSKRRRRRREKVKEESSQSSSSSDSEDEREITGRVTNKARSKSFVKSIPHTLKQRSFDIIIDKRRRMDDDASESASSIKARTKTKTPLSSKRQASVTKSAKSVTNPSKKTVQAASKQKSDILKKSKVKLEKATSDSSSSLSTPPSSGSESSEVDEESLDPKRAANASIKQLPAAINRRRNRDIATNSGPTPTRKAPMRRASTRLKETPAKSRYFEHSDDNDGTDDDEMIMD